MLGLEMLNCDIVGERVGFLNDALSLESSASASASASASDYVNANVEAGGFDNLHFQILYSCLL